MEEHNLRLLNRILDSLGKYENNEIPVGKLELDIEGSCNALEDNKLTNICRKLISKINDANYLYNENDGREFLLQEIAQFKENIKL